MTTATMTPEPPAWLKPVTRVNTQRGRDVYTSGQIAKLCHVAPRTVNNWFDGGLLKGYRIPGSQDRRIPRESLLRFLKAGGMPVPAELEGVLPRVLAVGFGPDAQDDMTAVAPPGVEFRFADDLFAAGVALTEWRPAVVIVDASVGERAAERVAKAAAEYSVAAAPCVLAADADFPPANPEKWAAVVPRKLVPAAVPRLLGAA